MSLFRQPDQLLDLSLHTFCKYMCSLVDVYTKTHRINDACYCLEYLLKDSVPQSLVNKVTENLLRALDSKLTHVDTNLNKLFDIIILPTVTRLDFCLDTLHQIPKKVFNYHWNGYIIPAVLQKVKVLQDLKVLRIFHTFYGKYAFPGSLEEFTYHNNCDNDILKRVSKCCKELRKLDVHNSTSIGDSSIALILTFKFLEHINLFGTYINEKGMTELLQNFNKGHICQLKSFGCSNLTSKQFEILIQNFPDLTCLKFNRNTHCEYNLLGNLKFLKSFSIMEVSGNDLEKILNQVGGQLVQLHFGCNEKFDLRKLADKCIAMKCLHISSFVRESTIPDVKEMKKLPGLKSVKCLCANFHYIPEAVACLICTCDNIEILEVDTDTDGTFIAESILRNPMTSLRELNWWCSGDAREVTIRVVQHCPNLEVLRGYYVWKKYGNVKNEIPLDRNVDMVRLL